MALLLLVFAALVPAALLALPTYRADAQTTGSGVIQGQILDGTKDAAPSSTAGLTVTLYFGDMQTAMPLTQTAVTDAGGQFKFSGLDTVTSTRYIATTTFDGVDYGTDLLAFDGVHSTLPMSMTVYSASSDPSIIQVAQTHFVIDVHTGALSVIEIVQVHNGSDKAFVGTDAVGPHRVTLNLPVLANATSLQFQDQQADATTIRGSDVLSYTLPIQPGDANIVFDYTVPFTAPTYLFDLKLPYDTPVFRVLLADVGGTIESSQLPAATKFATQGGLNYLQSAASNLTKGTEVKATLANLPATVVESPQTSASSTGATAAATDNNAQMIGLGVLGIAAVAAIGLLAYPLVRRRNARRAPASAPAAASSRRTALLQAIAELDDDFEAGKLSEPTYKEERARLKSKLVDLGEGD